MRGKQAAKAAKGRAASAEKDAQRAWSKLEAERSSWHVERAELIAQVQQLTNRLTGEVGRLSAASIEQAKAQSRSEIEQELSNYRSNLVQALSKIEKSDLLTLTGSPSFARFLASQDIAIHELGLAESRFGRRVSPAEYAANLTQIENETGGGDRHMSARQVQLAIRVKSRIAGVEVE